MPSDERCFFVVLLLVLLVVIDFLLLYFFNLKHCMDVVKNFTRNTINDEYILIDSRLLKLRKMWVVSSYEND